MYLWSPRRSQRGFGGMNRALVAIVVAALIGLVTAAVPVTADNDDELEVEFKISLIGADEVPAVETNSFGMAEVEIKVKNGVTTIKFEVEVCNIEAVAQAHIHASAPAGVNAPPRIFLFGNIADPALRPSFEDCTRLNKATLTDPTPIGMSLEALIDAIVSGNAYVNVHTTAHPGGEIRGQLV